MGPSRLWHYLVVCNSFPGLFRREIPARPKNIFIHISFWRRIRVRYLFVLHLACFYCVFTSVVDLGGCNGGKCLSAGLGEGGNNDPHSPIDFEHAVALGSSFHSRPLPSKSCLLDWPGMLLGGVRSLTEPCQAPLKVHPRIVPDLNFCFSCCLLFFKLSSLMRNDLHIPLLD